MIRIKTRVTCERIGASVLSTFSDDVAQRNVLPAAHLATIYPAIRISTAPTIFNPYSTISGRRLSLYSFTRSCIRSEEHTSELQSRGHIVCRLLLAK